MSTGLDIESIEHLDQDWDTACDYSDPEMGSGWQTLQHGPAEWQIQVGAMCGHLITRLTCNGCKETYLNDPQFAVHCYLCYEVAAPARLALHSIKRYDRRSA